MLSTAEQTSSFHPQNSFPGQRGCQHVFGGVWLGWRLLPHGHPLLGHGRGGGGGYRGWRSDHGHLRWVTERMWALSDSTSAKLKAAESLDEMMMGGRVKKLVEKKHTCCFYELFIVTNSLYWFLSLFRSQMPERQSQAGGEGSYCYSKATLCNFLPHIYIYEYIFIYISAWNEFDCSVLLLGYGERFLFCSSPQSLWGAGTSSSESNQLKSKAEPWISSIDSEVIENRRLSPVFSRKL